MTAHDSATWNFLSLLKYASFSHFHIFHFLFSIAGMLYSCLAGDSYLFLNLKSPFKLKFPFSFPSSRLLRNLNYIMAQAALTCRIYLDLAHALFEGRHCGSQVDTHSTVLGI